MTFDKPKRELVHPGVFSSYKRFWRRAQWEVFLQPRSGYGFDGAHKVDKEPEGLPGIYEFALSKGSSQRVKVYLGETRSVRARHAQYLHNGDHIRGLLDAALRDGCTVWRRYRYVLDGEPLLSPLPAQATKEEAVRLEAKWLGRLDYAFNAKLNGRKRHLSLHQQFCCLCIATGVDVVESEYQSPTKAVRAPSPSKQAAGQRSSPQKKKPLAAKQLQFVVST